MRALPIGIVIALAQRTTKLTQSKSIDGERKFDFKEKDVRCLKSEG